jgi:hypothetical protein
MRRRFNLLSEKYKNLINPALPAGNLQKELKKDKNSNLTSHFYFRIILACFSLTGILFSFISFSAKMPETSSAPMKILVLPLA